MKKQWAHFLSQFGAAGLDDFGEHVGCNPYERRNNYRCAVDAKPPQLEVDTPAITLNEDRFHQMSKSTDSEYVPALRLNWLTPYYDAVVGSTTRERTFKHALIRQANIQPGHQVLDLASGTGTLTIWIKQQESLASVTGIDGDPEIISIAKRKAANSGVDVNFDQGFSYQLPYAEAHFNRVLSSLFFHHLTLENKKRTAHELFRVLKPGAELHVADWGYPTSLLMRGLFYTVQLLDGFENTNDNVQGKLIGVFKDAGFTDVVQTKTFSTVYGTLALYSALKPS